MDLFILLLVLTFPSWGASYYIDSTCQQWITDIQNAFTEAQTMVSRAQQSITTPAQGGTGWNGYTWSAKGAALGDVLGTLFPQGLSAEQRTAISVAYGKFAAPTAMDKLWFVCEPISPPPTRLPNSIKLMTLNDISTPQGPQEHTAIVKGGAVPPPENTNQICLDGAAGCTLIGASGNIIVLTQVALVQGASAKSEVVNAWTVGDDVRSLATWSAASQALSQVTMPVSMDAVICRSLLSHYIVHEGFHSLGTPGNLAAVVNYTPESYGLNAIYQAASAPNAQDTDYWIRNADSLAIYADAVFVGSLTPPWSVFNGHLIPTGFWNRIQTQLQTDMQAAWNNPNYQLLPRDNTFQTRYTADWLDQWKDEIVAGEIPT